MKHWQFHIPFHTHPTASVHGWFPCQTWFLSLDIWVSVFAICFDQRFLELSTCLLHLVDIFVCLHSFDIFQLVPTSLQISTRLEGIALILHTREVLEREREREREREEWRMEKEGRGWEGESKEFHWGSYTSYMFYLQLWSVFIRVYFELFLDCCLQLQGIVKQTVNHTLYSKHTVKPSNSHQNFKGTQWKSAKKWKPFRGFLISQPRLKDCFLILGVHVVSCISLSSQWYRHWLKRYPHYSVLIKEVSPPISGGSFLPVAEPTDSVQTKKVS